MDTVRNQFGRTGSNAMPFGAFARTKQAGRTNPPFIGGRYTNPTKAGRTNAPTFSIKKPGSVGKKAAPKILKDTRTLEEVRGPTRRIREGSRAARRARVFRDQFAR